MLLRRRRQQQHTAVAVQGWRLFVSGREGSSVRVTAVGHYGRFTDFNLDPSNNSHGYRRKLRSKRTRQTVKDTEERDRDNAGGRLTTGGW